MSILKDDIEIIFELCKTNENKDLDFKLKLDFSNYKTKYEIAKDICAFANGENGGRIIIGVDDKTKEIVGIDEAIERDRIQQIVSKRIFPAPEFTIYSYPFNSKFIDVIKIATGKAVHWMGENKGVYIRRDAITDTATPEEIFILSYTRVVNRDILEYASKSKAKHWDPADTKLSDGKSELEYIEWSTISFQEPNTDPFTARNVISVPMSWTGLAPNYPDYPSSSYFAANCGFMFNIRTQESVLIELQTKINELHKIHSQAWTLQ
ncbi:MAG: AlbA family DNA-binding domain-containing protein, partial [Nitrososphaerales archaeon]